MRPLLASRSVPVTSGGFLGWIHHLDAVTATIAALEVGRPGQAYNIVDDRPATWQEVITTMAEGFGAPPPRRLPRWLMRLIAPYVTAVAGDTSMHVSNEKAKIELAWQPRFPTYRDGIAAMASGTAAESGDRAAAHDGRSPSLTRFVVLRGPPRWGPPPSHSPRS